jgi:hypothetical protein
MPTARVSPQPDGADEETGMAGDRWEYCYVHRANKEVHYCTLEGDRREKARDSSQAIAQLGQQGWELAAADIGVNLFFKRRIE